MSEILADFLEFREEGLYCKYGDFYLDARKPVRRAVISHGHGDHTVGGCSTVYATSPTLDFIRCRYGKNAGKFLISKQYKETFTIEGIDITFFPAGHILGSAIILMTYKGVNYLYTGDYKLQEDATCEPIEFVKADVLITESTFANPEIGHPDPIAEIQRLNAIKYPIMLGAYSLGKAQRLTRLITTYCENKQVLVHHAILPFHRIYESNGIGLGKYQPYNRKYFKSQTDHMIYLVPPLTFNSYFAAKNVLRAFVSGWKHLQGRNDISICISDHVDWMDIIQTIKKTEPKQIWTVHGDGKFLADFYKNNVIVKHLS